MLSENNVHDIVNLLLDKHREIEEKTEKLKESDKTMDFLNRLCLEAEAFSLLNAVLLIEEYVKKCKPNYVPKILTRTIKLTDQKDQLKDVTDKLKQSGF